MIKLLAIMMMWAGTAWGQAVNFSGTYNFINIPNSILITNMTEISVSVWIYLQAQPKDYWAVCTKTSSISWNDGFGLGSTSLKTDPISWWVNHYSTGAVRGVAMSSNRWHHVCGTYDGASLKLYQDGVLTTNRSYSTAYNPSTAPIWIGVGAGSGGASQYNIYNFKGNIADFRLYSRALSLAEVQAIAFSFPSGSDKVFSSLVGRWCFAAKQTGSTYLNGNVAIDIGNNRLNGTYSNSVANGECKSAESIIGNRRLK